MPLIGREIHPDTRCIADLLNETPRGGTITMADISKAIGREVAPVRYLIYAAMKIAQRETGAAFISVRGKGYRRAAPEDLKTVAVTGRARGRRIHDRARKSVTAGMAAENDMPAPLRRELLREVSQLNMMYEVGRDRYLVHVPEEKTRPLPVAVSARMFLHMMGAKPDLT